MQPQSWILLCFASGIPNALTQKADDVAMSRAQPVGYSSTELPAQHLVGDQEFTRTRSRQPIGVRKMSDDEGEMFFLDYWQLDPLASRASIQSDLTDTGNSTYQPFNPPLSPHSDSYHSSKSLRIAHQLFKRDFQCPTNTFACTSIGQPNNCCANGETCISVQDTGLGPVGCCPQGQSCGGAVASCNTAQGYSSCPGSPNGGCCIPGYSCQGVGCVLTGTSVLTPTPAPTPTPTSSSSAAVSSVTSTDTTVSTVTTTVVISPSASAQPTTVTQTLTITSSASESGTAVPPVRPTSDSSPTSPSTTTTTSTTQTSAPADQCPTNFYRCSAYYVGGCCRVGRDCSSTSCPPASSTVVASNTHATVVAPSGGSCANGWQSCAASVGGGCCPGGYVCGTATCSATAAGQSGVSKSGAPTRRAGKAIVIPAMSSIGLLLLMVFN
ncbi:hypothetical protein K461DRAFT_274653 [Myriangium duriaei CBS 260.36]|uniref:GPI anchored protein n=1 Tax=Myriangium duriaei CBS 260.36 TaxID=1168546 RepID=A0A9P4MJW0_9PEZI|nr:hypothetical protein K461DRAFT_274653 [Myriangium duriaei CBS 260.36]